MLKLNVQYEREQPYPLTGIVDEVRLSTVSRSSNWIWTAYNVAANNTNLTYYGTVTTKAITTTAIYYKKRMKQSNR